MCVWVVVHLRGEDAGSKAARNAPLFPESQAKWNGSELTGSYFLRFMPGRRQDQAMLCPESIYSLLVQINQLASSAGFGSAGNVHCSRIRIAQKIPSR